MKESKILLSNNEQRLTYYCIYIYVGSLNEKDNERGLAHFVEHMNMCFRKYDLLKECDNYLAYAITDYYSTTYIIGMPWRDRKKGISVIDNILKGTYIDQIFLEEVRQDILSEIQDKNNDIENELLDKIFFKTKYHGREPVGNIENIENYNIDEIKKFFLTWYQKENIKIICLDENQSNYNYKILKNNSNIQYKLKPTICNWNEKEIEIDKKRQKVRIVYKIEKEKYKIFFSIDCFLYSFMLEMLSENIEIFLNEKLNMNYISCETKILSAVEDLWWVELNENEYRKYEWNMIKKDFLDWIYEYWEEIVERCKTFAEHYNEFVSADYILERMKEEFIYGRKYLGIDKEKEIIDSFISSKDAMHVYTEFVKRITNDDKVVIYY